MSDHAGFDSVGSLPRKPVVAPGTNRGDYIGLDWPGFVARWCDGILPDASPEDVRIALGALQRLDPAYIPNRFTENVWGLWVVAPAVQRGLVLHLCEHIAGFEPVRQRIIDGERSAWMEATCAAAYARCGFAVRFGVQVGGRVLDLGVSVDGVELLVEVVAPDRSDAVTAAWQRSDAIAHALLQISTGYDVELYLPRDPSRSELTRLLRLIQSARAGPDIQDLGQGVLLIKDTPARGGVMFRHRNRIPVPRDGSVFERCYSDQIPDITLAHVKLRLSDDRARRFVKDEAHHFSHGRVNILVVDVTNVPGGYIAWPTLLAGAFNERRHTRISAIVAIAELQRKDPFGICVYFESVPNPYARLAAPAAFLKAI